ncbi:MAG: 3'-5' exonuclease domain-containing protein 2 [Magnetococcales bacterium]|nr:3'-5' exonuclease domain-containing protein 2 [Magnetococcales bacterium]
MVHDIPAHYRKKVTKEEINLLPIRSWTGPIHIITTDEQAIKAVSKLKKHKVLGFDTETRPVFRKGQSRDPALLQLADANDAYIFQLKRFREREALRSLLEKKSILKVGVALKQDIRQLQPILPFRDAGFVDLAVCARNASIPSQGLRTLSAAFLGCRISKRAQCSNWDRSNLADFQIKYAATDAWISREIYLKMKEFDVVDRRFN